MKPKPGKNLDAENSKSNNSWPLKSSKKPTTCRPPLLTLSKSNLSQRNNVPTTKEAAKKDAKEDIFYCLSSGITRKRGDFIEECSIDTKRYFDKSPPSKLELTHKPEGIWEVSKHNGPDSTESVCRRPEDWADHDQCFTDAHKYFDEPITLPKVCSDKQVGIETALKSIASRKGPLRALRNVYADYLYDDDYIQSNYYYLLEVEQQYTLRKSYLEERCNMTDRQMVVNWIVHVTQKLYLQESTMFSAVRMFDTFLVRSETVEPERYYLNALTCIWISSKLGDRTIPAVKLYNACARKYNRAQFVAAERNILCQLNFNVNYPEPLVVLNYYLKRQCLQNNNNVRYAAVFLLECFMLFSEFSSSSPSLLAAAALFLTYLKLGMLLQASLFRNFIEDHLLPKALFEKFSLALYNLVMQNVFCSQSILWNTVTKYSTEEKLKVACMFISIP